MSNTRTMVSVLTLALAGLVTANLVAAPRQQSTSTKQATRTKQATTTQQSNQTQQPNATEQATINMIKELHQSQVVLEHAIHDYDGHRSHAVHDLGKAITQLKESLPAQHHHHVQHATATTAKKTATKSTTKNNNGTNETQAQSDTQVQQVRTHLKSMEGSLSQLSGPHHQKALADVNSAIHHLDTALKLK